MRSDGTVLGRKFINFPSDKDRMYRVLGRIRRFQREYGSRSVQSRWSYAKRLNMELSRKTANAIVRYACENQADILVFEYLEMKGSISGKKRQKLHMWRKRDIQKICELFHNCDCRCFTRVPLRSRNTLLSLLTDVAFFTLGPVSPLGPGIPCSPLGPCSPRGPSGPAGPGGPWIVT